jgi:DNA-binding NtrC family response regulator
MRIMLVEDDPLLRDVLIEALTDAGFEVDGLDNAEDAIVLVGAGQVPDVLVADIHLGEGRDGFDLVADVQKRHPELRAIFVSGSHPGEPAHRLPRHEVFLHKPFSAEGLVKAVRSALDSP